MRLFPKCHGLTRRGRMEKTKGVRANLKKGKYGIFYGERGGRYVEWSSHHIWT